MPLARDPFSPIPPPFPPPFPPFPPQFTPSVHPQFPPPFSPQVPPPPFSPPYIKSEVNAPGTCICTHEIFNIVLVASQTTLSIIMCDCVEDLPENIVWKYNVMKLR